jgi:uncharacterized protein (TIRG00374 family)
MPRIGLVAIGVAVSCLGFWLALRSVSLRDVWASLEAAEWQWLVPALALTYLTLAIRAVRWRLLFQNPKSITTWEAAKTLNIGLMFNAVLPSRAGEVPRTFALGHSTGLSKLEIAGTIVVERLLDLLSVAVIGVLIWPWLPREPWLDTLGAICGVIVAGIFVGGGMAFLLRRSVVPLAARILRRVPFVPAARAEPFVASLVRGLRVVRDPRRLVVALALSALVWVATALSIVALYPAFGLSTTSLSPWLILVAMSLAMTVPSTAGGLGVYEAAVQSSLVATGVATSTALSFAFALHAVNLIPIVLTGSIAAWSNALTARNAQRRSSAARG